MIRYRLTPQANRDVFEIWSYIARDSVEAADQVENAIYEACAFVANGPMRGRLRKDLTTLPLRFWTVQPYRNYILVFDPESRPLQIVRVLHGGQNLPVILKEKA